MMHRQFQRPEVLGINLPQPKLRIALGMTCSGVNTLSVDTNTGTLAYPASGVVVLFDTNENRQIQYINQPRKTVSCVSFSPDGKLLLIGETGSKPSLHVWSVPQRKSLADFQDHSDAITCAKFSASMEIIASVGGKHDGSIIVHAWPSQFKIFSNRFAETLYTVSFSSKCLTIVTCGSRHVKFWYPKLDNSVQAQQCQRTSALFGRRAILGSHKNKTFVDVAWGSSGTGDYVYTVTSCGVILKISAANRSVVRSMYLQNKKLSSLQVHGEDLFVGTANGCVIILDIVTMKPITSLMSPVDASYAEQAFQNQEDTEDQSIMTEHTDDVYLALDYVNRRLVAALTNSSMCIWDIKDPNDIKKTHYSVGHSKGISDMDLMSPKAGDTSPWSESVTPDQETIVTVSHDSTVRLWKMFMSGSIYCESSKTIYTDLERAPVYPATDKDVKGDACMEPRMITAAKVSQENDLITAGDNNGLIHVYDARTLANVNVLHKHSRTVTTLCFFSGNGNMHRLLISSSKDRLINIFNVDAGFTLLNSLKFHSGSVTTVGLCGTPEKLMLISASVDRSVVLCGCQWDHTHDFRLYSSFTTASAVIDIVINQMDHHVVVGRNNGEISILNVRRLKLVQRINTCHAEHIHLERLHLDDNARLLLCAFSNRSINILSYPRGINLTSVNSHCKDVTRLRFSSNTRCIVSSSSDGCIFVWSLPSKIVKAGTILKSVWKTSQEKKLREKSPSQQKKTVEVISPRLHKRHTVKYAKQKEIKDSVNFEPIFLKREKIKPSPIYVKVDEHKETDEDILTQTVADNETYSCIDSMEENSLNQEDTIETNKEAHSNGILKSESFTVEPSRSNTDSDGKTSPLTDENKQTDSSHECENANEEDVCIKGEATLMNSVNTTSLIKDIDHTLIEGSEDWSSVSCTNCHLNESCDEPGFELGYNGTYSGQEWTPNDIHFRCRSDFPATNVLQHVQGAVEEDSAELDLYRHDVKTPDRIFGKDDTESEASVASDRSGFSNKVWKTVLLRNHEYLYCLPEENMLKKMGNNSTTNNDMNIAADVGFDNYPVLDINDENTESLDSSPSPDFGWERDGNMQLQYYVDDAPPPVQEMNGFNMRVQPGLALPFVASDPCNRIQPNSEYNHIEQTCETMNGEFYPNYTYPNVFGTWHPNTFCTQQEESYQQSYNYGDAWESGWEKPSHYYVKDIDGSPKPINREVTLASCEDSKPFIPKSENIDKTDSVVQSVNEETGVY